ncbi:MAG: V-type ATP synthase subunit D [Lentisphaerae bacterium]|nr:V-type ATP synthase subunit D [Lentisphaerota bacterium]
MAKVKLTKTELKAQKDALARYERFLPMLQLKKQQLQMEISTTRSRVEELVEKQESIITSLSRWLGLLADEAVEVPVIFKRIVVDTGNIAGVSIPIFKNVETHRKEVDLFSTPAWVDDAAAAAEKLIGINAEKKVLERQIELIEEELRTTSQRVNLFEKVKIPECRENIRIIGIMLGDEQTSAVVRGKIAKGRDKNSGHKQTVEAMA